MHLFRDEIVPEIETSDNEQHSHDTEEDQIVRYERMAEDAPPLNNDYEIEDAPPMDAPTTSKKRKRARSYEKPQRNRTHAFGIQCIGSILRKMA